MDNIGFTGFAKNSTIRMSRFGKCVDHKIFSEIIVLYNDLKFSFIVYKAKFGNYAKYLPILITFQKYCIFPGLKTFIFVVFLYICMYTYLRYFMPLYGMVSVQISSIKIARDTFLNKQVVCFLCTKHNTYNNLYLLR